MSLLGNVLGAVMGGGAAGSENPIQGMIMSMLSGQPTHPTDAPAQATPAIGGLGGLVQMFEQAGAGNVVQSWISHGSNLPISAETLQSVLGSAQVENMASKVGIDPKMLLGLLAQHLPAAVDQMTPHGTLPQA